MTWHLFSQEKTGYQITKLIDGIYELVTDGGGYPDKVIVSAGEDGVLIVDSGDIILWFIKSKIVCTGALCMSHHFPSIDSLTGNIYKYPGIVEKVIGILPEDVRIILGHNDDCTMKESEK